MFKTRYDCSVVKKKIFFYFLIIFLDSPKRKHSIIGLPIKSYNIMVLDIEGLENFWFLETRASDNLFIFKKYQTILCEFNFNLTNS